jgi:hypothetical protein
MRPVRVGERYRGKGAIATSGTTAGRCCGVAEIRPTRRASKTVRRAEGQQRVREHLPIAVTEGALKHIGHGAEPIGAVRVAAPSSGCKGGSDRTAIAGMSQSTDETVGLQPIDELCHIGSNAAQPTGELTQGEGLVGARELVQNGITSGGKADLTESLLE